MHYEILRYPVQHDLLKRYIKFFWEIHIEHAQLNHKVIPVRNIDLKFNLNETPHYVCMKGKEHRLEEIYFTGLQDHFREIYMKIYGKVDILGICFQPEGFYPFIRIPLSEIKNQTLGACEVGFRQADTICNKLKEAHNVAARLNVLERELISLLDNGKPAYEDFRQIFIILNQSDSSPHIDEFCQRNNIGMRKLERMYSKYVGISAKTYSTLNRFQNGLNQLLYSNYSKLSDIAYGNDYFDQMHFIKDFRRFTGNTPKSFVPQNNTMLHIGKFA